MGMSFPEWEDRLSPFQTFHRGTDASGNEGQFSIEVMEDVVEVFHFPDHQIKDIDPKLKTDLEDVLKKATDG